ncbi:hypothetical protein Pint_29676 [Pistacia integerrima]|uniref:Uncharacterized protein n=1 Tax=Pistacia integerrima TaxID=434235 RepID=A0ACC0X2E2_9ROSI|nr:hypothetical protein Pint_29676 [Pistacia integerrima]
MESPSANGIFLCRLLLSFEIWMRKGSSTTAHKQLMPNFQDNEGILEQRTDYHLNTVLHLASRFRHAELVKDIIEFHPKMVETVNKKLVDKTGHLDVVKLMMNQSWLMDFEEDEIDLTALHVAASMGHTGYLAITRLFLRLEQDLALQYNDKGYTPLHLEAIHGKVPILEDFLLSSPTSFQYLTKEGETVCHLAVKFNQYDALDIRYLKFLNGLQTPGNAESKQLTKAVKAAAGKSTELLPPLGGAQETNSQQQTLENSKDILETKNMSLLQYLIDIGNGCELPLDFKLGYRPGVVPTPSSSMSAKSRKDSDECEIEEKYGSHDSSRIKLQIQKKKLDMLTTRP